MRIIIISLLVMGLGPWAQALCVKVEKAELRKSPSQSAAVSWTVGKYMPLLRIDEKEGWYKVRDLDGEEHWVESGAVSNQYSCLVVKAPYINLRTGPGLKFQIAEFSLVDKYTPFRDLLWEDGWYEVEDVDGNRFWLPESKVWKARERMKLEIN